MPKTEKDFLVLKATVEAITSLIEQLITLIKNSPTGGPTNQKQPKDINAISLAYDASSLIRAHTTKLSLLMINLPFTPTAIHTVLQQLINGPLPALATAVEVCDATSYTEIMRSELQWLANKVFVELLSLIKIIPLEHEERETVDGRKKATLATTGILWQACDNVIALKELGIAGLLIRKAEQYRETLKDALAELQEWGEETSYDDEEPEGDGESEAIVNGDISSSNDILDNFFDSPRHIPKNDCLRIRERLSKVLQRLRLIQHLYSAIIKRRLKTLPVLPLRPDLLPDLNSVVERIDRIMSILKKLPDITDELAIAFYELDSAAIERRMDDCFSTSFSASELSALTWKGGKDEYSVWAQRFQQTIKHDGVIESREA